MRWLAILSLCAVLAGAAWSFEDKPEPKQNVAPKGFTALFNGEDLTGWQGGIHIADLPKLKPDELHKRRTTANLLAKDTWTVKDGVLMMKPKLNEKKQKSGVNLATMKDYRHFELLIDWKIEKAGDSGIYLRGQPQVQIWDSDTTPGARDKDKNSGSGALWNNPENKGKRPLEKADKPVGEWNTFRIVLKDDKVTVHLNGTLVIKDAPLMNIWEPKNEVQKKGPIELQYHGDPLYFRNIFIKELSDE